MKDLDYPPLLKALKNYSINDNGCFIYQGYRDKDNYGVFGHYKLHRVALAKKLEVSYESLVLACHNCNNRSCINDKHVYNGDSFSNMADAIYAGVGGAYKNQEKTHCLRGHELNDRNTYLDSKLQRSCKICRLKARRDYVARKLQRAIECQKSK